MKNKPKDTEKPIPIAYINVPIPTFPPKKNPIPTADSSSNVLINEIEKLVCLFKPVINPSLGPGPKFAAK